MLCALISIMAELNDNVNRKKTNSKQESITQNNFNIKIIKNLREKLEFCQKWQEYSNFENEDTELIGGHDQGNPIHNSSRVNLRYKSGTIYHILNTEGGIIGTLNQKINADKNADNVLEIGKISVNKENDVERIEENIYIGPIVRQKDSGVLKIIDRNSWIAQPPIAFEEMKTPVPFVIISHTGTEMTTTQAETIFVIRNIQTYHIESRNWWDIGYSFLIGCDCNVYEGRGWKRVGAHTYGYNKRGIGITFIGCFSTELPPSASLYACKLLIQKGVNEGYISPDYKLLGNCQSSATESPGKRLFEEIKTWPNWTGVEICNFISTIL